MPLSPALIASLRTSAGLSTTPPTPTQNGANDILEQRKAALGLDKSVEEVKPTLVSKNSASIQKRGGAMYADITSTEGNSDNPFVQGVADLSHGVHAAGNAFGAVTDIAGNVVGSLMDHLGIKNNQVEEKPIAPAAQAIKDTVSSTASKAYDELGLRLKEIITTHPEIGKVIESGLRTLQGGGETAGGILTAEGVSEGAQKGVDLTKEGFSKGKEIAGNVKDVVTGKVNELKVPEQNDLEKISETISPKPTIKQAKLAETEGRLYKAKEPGLFTKGGEDKIAASTQQADSVRTIHENIPGAANMDEPTLYTALDEKISETAQALKPEMVKTPIHPDTVEKIGSDWESVKASQADNAYTPSDVNVKKLQADFQERIKDLGDSSNMNDIWETRKAYDASVPTNVKTANDLSSEALQAKKDIWLQNRKILSDAITDTENGMGETARKPFGDMRNMYEAKNGILSKAKVETTAAPSKASEFFNKTTVGKVTKHIIKGAAGAAVGKTVGGTAGEVAGGVIGAGL